MQISSRVVKYLVLSGFALFLGGQVSRVNAQSWYNTSWLYRNPVAITNSSGGTLSSFQVNVALDSANFNFSDALSTGADLRVTDSTGTALLPFWIEYWNATTQSASIWVNVTSIPTTGTTIYLYYGNAAAASTSSGSTTFLFFDNFDGTPTAATSYWALSSATLAMQQDQTWEVSSGPHYMSVVVPPTASNGGYTYWGYYGTYECDGIGLAQTNNLSGPWTKASTSAPLYGAGNARWPSVLTVTSGSTTTWYMAYTKNFCAGTGSYLELATSTNGTTFTDSVALVPALSNNTASDPYANDLFNQNPFLYLNPNDATDPYYLYYYTGESEIHVRKAATVPGLATATDSIVLQSSTTMAAPNVYYNAAAGLYFLAVESYTSSGVWETDVYTSTSATTGFKLLPGSPILTNNDACMTQWVFPASTTTLEMWYCEMNSSTDTWTLQHRTATLTATAGTAGRASVNTPNTTLWTVPLRTGSDGSTPAVVGDGGARGAWTIVSDTQEDGTTGNVAFGVTQDRQTLLSTYNSGGSSYVLDAYGKQLQGVDWGLATEATDWLHYYSLNLNDNLNSTPPNLFLYGWVDDGGPYASVTLGSANGGTINPNTWYHLTEKVNPPTFDVYLGTFGAPATLEFTGTDSNLTTGGVALYGEGGTQAEWNNVFVRQYASADPVTTVGTNSTQELLSLGVSPTSVAAGSNSTGTVTLESAAGSGGVKVNLTSSDTSVATVPSSITITSATSGTFTVTTIAGSTTTIVTITASYSTASLQTSLTVTANNPVPTISSLSPASAVVGAAAQTLTINGTGFLSTSTVTFNGVPQSTVTYVSSTELTIPLTATEQATAGSYPVDVSNPAPGGGSSNVVDFSVGNPAPTVTTLSPSSATAGAAAQTLTINGTGFVSTSTVTYNAVGHTATLVNSTQLTITLSPTDQATAGTDAVVVTNPAPGGGSSSPVNFTVNNPVPTVTTLSPSSANAGAAAQTLTINGTNFVSTSTVTYNGSAHVATYISATQLTISLTTADQAAGGNYPVVVTNPTPGGGASAQVVNFTVNNPVPTVTTLSPSSALAGAAAQTLTLNGTNFVSTSTVTYNGLAHTATFVGATMLTISLTTADQASAGTYPVVVTNPTPGGGSSTAVNFTVSNPVPTVTTLSPASALVGAAAQTLTINGTNFVSTSTVTYNALAHTATYVSATQLTITLSTTDQATAGSYAVVVTNPAPGGGSSTQVVNFTVNNQGPAITSLSPSSVSAGAAAQTLTINGTNFLSTSTVTYNAVGHTATYVSATQLTISLSTSDLATAGTYPVVVTNPAPGGGSSTPVNFTVNNLVPSVTSFSPTSANAGAAAQTLTINGTNFLSTSTVTYNALAHAATFVSATQLTISLTAADQATGGTYAIVVTNPAPGGGSSSPVNFTVNNLVPTITSLSPATLSAGAAAQTLTINGTNFVSNSTVTYNAVAHAPTFVSATQLTISLSTSDLAAAGNFAVVVTNPSPGGGASNSLNFIADNPLPTITSLSPSSATMGAAAQTLTINGTNFVSTSTVTYNSVAHTPTFVSATQLTISLSTTDQATVGTYSVVVTNPAPGGGDSSPATFTVNNPVPTITTLSPSSATAGAAVQTLTITGTNFVSNSTVTYNALAHAATFVSATQLTISLTVADQATGGTYPVVVTNPTPGGGASSPVNFTVNNPVPTITTLSPSSALAGAAAQTLTINGTNFVSTSTVTYNAVAHTATYVSATQLTISLSASDQASAGTYPVVVTNPAPGGGSSAAVNFTLDNGVPTVTSLSPTSAILGAAAQTLTINGTNFVPTSTVTYNGVTHTPVYVSGTQLTISLSTTDQATAGTYPVVVTNPAPGGGSSTQVVDFMVNNPQPTVTTLSPSSAIAGAAAQTLTINGTNFLSTSTVTYNAVAHTATYVSATQLTITLSTTDQATAGSYAVVVTNPAPVAGPSTPVNFTVNNPAPTVATLSPSSGIAEAAAQSLTINGTNFVSTSAVTYNGVAHTATFVSSTQLTISLTTADQAAGGTFPVVVTNPAPGGGSSSPVSFTIEDFSVVLASGSSSSATVSPGVTATYSLSIAAMDGLTGTVSVTCSGAPSEATCTANPTPVTLSASGATTTVSVSTTAASAVLMRPKPPVGPWLWLWMLALLAAAGTWLLGDRRLTWRRAWAPLAVAMLSVALWAGCGGGGGGGGGSPSNPGTPAGTYNLTVTVTYTSGTTTDQHTFPITLTVN